MRNITSIILHCSASDNPNHDNIETIRNWHISRGWSDVGYHYFYRKDGTEEIGRPLEVIGSHVHGHNSHSIGLCFHGLEKDLFTEQQFMAGASRIKYLLDRFNLSELDILHHNELDPNKTCPVFNWHETIRKYL